MIGGRQATRILVCADPLDKRHVDFVYEPEAAAASGRGVAYELDHAERNCRRFGVVRADSAASVDEVRGVELSIQLDPRGKHAQQHRGGVSFAAST
jgi:hypothetical protein